jgi:hypothetical protein
LLKKPFIIDFFSCLSIIIHHLFRFQLRYFDAKKNFECIACIGVIGHSPAVPIIANQEFAAVAKKLKAKKDRERKISFVVGAGRQALPLFY